MTNCKFNVHKGHGQVEEDQFLGLQGHQISRHGFVLWGVLKQEIYHAEIINNQREEFITRFLTKRKWVD